MISLNQLLFEEQEPDGDLDEATYPSEFDSKSFESLSLAQKAKYARKHLQYIAKGSSRIVLLIDQETVLKIAINKAGLAQNRTEADVSNMFPSVVAKVLKASSEVDWIEAEKATPATTRDFDKFLGLPTSLFFNFLGNFLSKVLDGTEVRLISQHHKKAYEEFAESEFAAEVLDVAGNYDLLKEDLLQESAWGVVKRNGVPRLVLIDYGITNSDYKFFYAPKRNLNRK
jgi:hypothetical protein